MSSIGFGLIKSLVVNSIPFHNLNSYKIDEHYFKDKEVDAFLFIKEFILEYGIYPQIDTIERHIKAPEVFTSLPNEPLEFWVSEVLQRKRYDDLRSCLNSVRDSLFNHNLDEALDIMGSGYLSVRESYTTRRMQSLSEAQEEVVKKHDEFQAKPDLPGISFGFPFLDNISGGAQKGDFIIIVGQTSVGKTYLALRIAKSAYDTWKNVIVLSTELPNIQSARRILAMEGKFSATDLKLGRLSYFGREKAQRIIDEGAVLSSDRGNYFYLLPGGMFPKVEDLVIVVKEMKPDLLVIDGAYLLQSKARTWWEKNMEVAMILKNLSLTEDIPVIATYQYLKKDKGTLEGVGGGFAIPQIASMVLSFEFERKEDIGSTQGKQYRVLRLTKGRDGESGSMRVEYNMKTTQLVQHKVLQGRVAEEDLIETDDIPERDDQDYAEI